MATNKTQVLSARGAGKRSTAVTDAGGSTTKTQVLSDVGVVTNVKAATTSSFIIHPFV